VKLLKIEEQVVRKLQSWELVGFELSMLESVSSRKNISDPRRAK
jgi:hypothetical protein